MIIPQKMKGLVQLQPGKPLEVAEMDVPRPGKGEVLVKMAAAPVNPSDLSLLNGTYAVRPDYPYGPGIEGSGLVVESGKGFLPYLRNGKRVACTSIPGRNGTWAEYMVTSAMRVIPLEKVISYTQGAMLLVNPLTAIAFLSMVKSGKHNSAVIAPASSSLGKMLIRLFAREGITPINIVRNDVQKKALGDIGAEIVLDSSREDFEQELSGIIDGIGTKLYFDAVGGKITETFLRVSPPGSRIVLYGNLSESDFTTDPRIIIQKSREICGFFLGNHTGGRSVISNLKDISLAKSLVKGALASDISGKCRLEEANVAIESYRNNMSAGKVLIMPNPDLI